MTWKCALELDSNRSPRAGNAPSGGPSYFAFLRFHQAVRRSVVCQLGSPVWLEWN